MAYGWTPEKGLPEGGAVTPPPPPLLVVVVVVVVVGVLPPPPPPPPPAPAPGVHWAYPGESDGPDGDYTAANVHGLIVLQCEPDSQFVGPDQFFPPPGQIS